MSAPEPRRGRLSVPDTQDACKLHEPGSHRRPFSVSESAVGGPFGAILGKVAGAALGEDELHEDEFEMHHEDEYEAHNEHHESHHEILPELHESHNEHHELHESHHEMHEHHEALAEMMAEAAAESHNEMEAEAMAGAAAVATLSISDRAALRRLLPHLIRGVAVLTRILRRRRLTRPVLRTVPTIVRQTVRTLKRRIAAGQPVSRRIAGQILASNTRRMLVSPRACGIAIVRNVRTNWKANAKPSRRVRG